MNHIRHEFVTAIPEKLEQDVVYVSIPYATAAHLCACGCGQEVNTPLTPTDWAIIYNGETVSLYPSIGNWSFPCRSHYWIKNDQVLWAKSWSQKKIDKGRETDQKTKARFFGLRKKEQKE